MPLSSKIWTAETRAGFLKTYNNKERPTFINLLDSDDAADILNELPIKTRGGDHRDTGPGTGGQVI